MSTLDAYLSNRVNNLQIQDQGKMKVVVEEKVVEEVGLAEAVDERVHGNGLCAICLDRIVIQETALVKGCEHAYCVTCILQWASYNENPKCPQCKHPFEALNVHRSLDGSFHDYMFEESVYLLLTASWFNPLVVEPQDDFYDELRELEFYQYQYDEYEEEDEDIDEAYFSHSPSLRIGNRRWGDNGYIRSGRQEVRPVNSSNLHDSGAGSSREPKKKERNIASVGRRAKRTLKREAADKAAAA
ncbi:hypothetical protein AKJ16_DCAP21066 [Drosera capensis]